MVATRRSHRTSLHHLVLVPHISSQDPATLMSRAGSWVFRSEPSGATSDDNPNQISSTESSEPLERHSEFFFDNTLVAIRIGKTLFNVHKYQLAKSEVFSDMFKMPKPEGKAPEEGSSPEYPIKLEGVAASDFAALLRVLYASHFSDDPPAPQAPLVIPAFRLANMFNFSKLRGHLLPLAEQNLDDVDKIVFAREFDIKDWLVPAHVRLCQREKPLNDEEARKLGVGSVLIISRMREQRRPPPPAVSFVNNQYYCGPCTGTGFIGFGTGSCTHATCYKCHAAGYGRLRYTGPGGTAHSNTTTVDNATIEASVKKWVADGCTIKD
ncbi:hypothetical protein B0J17DRAFT_660615 [Rhizoctonia solani]|nr:hypothetical protein B0J17DRAFT_660615 [Rhizoctonia solani]